MLPRTHSSIGLIKFALPVISTVEMHNWDTVQHETGKGTGRRLAHARRMMQRWVMSTRRCGWACRVVSSANGTRCMCCPAVHPCPPPSTHPLQASAGPVPAQGRPRRLHTAATRCVAGGTRTTLAAHNLAAPHALCCARCLRLPQPCPSCTCSPEQQPGNPPGADDNVFRKEVVGQMMDERLYQYLLQHTREPEVGGGRGRVGWGLGDVCLGGCGTSKKGSRIARQCPGEGMQLFHRAAAPWLACSPVPNACLPAPAPASAGAGAAAGRHDGAIPNRGTHAAESRAGRVHGLAGGGAGCTASHRGGGVHRRVWVQSSRVVLLGIVCG